MLYECYKKKIWKAKKSIIPSSYMGDLEDEDSDEVLDADQLSLKEAIKRSFEQPLPQDEKMENL